MNMDEKLPMRLLMGLIVALSDEELDQVLKYRDDQVNMTCKYKHFHKIIKARFGKDAVNEVWDEAQAKLAEDLAQFEVERKEKTS
jgi:hypothetical protein